MQRNILFVVLAVTAGIIILISNFSIVYAQNTYDINIPSGASDVDAPFHWQSEKDGDASGNIEITVNDSIHWKNGDTAPHTVTSGTPQSGPDGVFDSGSFGPAETFLYQFTEVGKYPYYCTLHPWMTAVVTVTSGLSTISNVGLDAGDHLTTFDVEYDFNRVINTASVNEETKSITFEFIGHTNSDDNTLRIVLPIDLIDGITTVSIDGVQTSEFELIPKGDTTILVVNSLVPESESLTISGVMVVPEFGSIVILVLIVSVSSLILLGRKQIFKIPN